MAYSPCGVPYSLKIVNNNNNTLTLSCIPGADGTDNIVVGVQFFITCNGSAPTPDNYDFSYRYR